MPTSLSAMLALFNDNTAGDISAADGRAVIQALWDWIPPVEKYKMGRQAGETAHASDDFFTAYSGYTEVVTTGTTVWAASRGGLGVTWNSVAAQDFNVALKAVPAGLPITIETLLVPTIKGLDYTSVGILFTDGTSTTSNLAGMGTFYESGGPNQIIYPTGTLTNCTYTNGSFGRFAVASVNNLFMRLVWTAANTFKTAWSPDGQLWSNYAVGPLTRTLTPTHMGFFVGNYETSGLKQTATFKYLRVYEADLSV